MKPSTSTESDDNKLSLYLRQLAKDVVEVGQQAGLPYIATSADVSDPSPMRDEDGTPYAESLFHWFDPDFHYWDDRTFALRSGFVQAARICAEPIYFDGARLASWRRNAALDAFNDTAEYDLYGVSNAIICPCYMPYGVLGVIVWATNESIEDIESTFRKYAGEMHLLTLKFLCAHREIDTHVALPEMVDLTRREIQCLKWAAIGKTDSEIATIMGKAIPTIRFHLTNASQKLGVTGRAQAVRVATSLGYIGRSA